MNIYVTSGLSLVFLLSLTSFRIVQSGAPLFQLSNQRSGSSMSSDDTLIRHTRNIHGHVPCIFMSQITGIKSRFEKWMDKNTDGRADFHEVRDFLRSLKADVTDDVVNAFIHRRDENGNGQIDLIPEYLKEIVENDYGVQAATEWFYLHDVNGNGYVSKPELIRLGMAIGMSREQAENTALGYYLPLDSNGDGQLDFEEFSKLYEEPTMPME